ncbi:uncharacterized protein YxeA [Paenibacillus phyllosphaerae]|uniref:Uncharacterized protein YxeA n=1 Tax=Paenibacillus phyllosphaerae TaxID=274593 RepID=A0A7W5B1C7_9BACL|nr:hypothetical protein [Paenibacillus phyllosphaerae]MBB3112597.1 uncharacterized protein YxeA [Paenibacillus phyllosphaerae]
MKKVVTILGGLIVSAMAPLLFMLWVNHDTTTYVIHEDGSGSATTMWVSFTLTSYLVTVIGLFALYMAVWGLVVWWRKKRG